MGLSAFFLAWTQLEPDDVAESASILPKTLNQSRSQLKGSRA